jgi:hypothetical protein
LNRDLQLREETAHRSLLTPLPPPIEMDVAVLVLVDG